MRIMTWNINGVSYWDSVKILNPFNPAKPRYSYIRRAIEKYDPDILLLQEVIFPWDNSFVDSIGRYHIANQKTVRSGGLAAATKRKTAEVKYIIFEEQASLFKPKQFSDKFLRKGYQEIDLGDYLIINTHLANSYTPEDVSDLVIQRQAEQLLEHIRKRKNEQREIILAGDLNFRKHSALYDAFAYELEDLTASLPTTRKGYGKVDFIFANAGNLTNCGYVEDESFKEKYPSDHPGIYVDLKPSDR